MRTNLQDKSDARDNNLLVPCFQPCVELRIGPLVGLEALARCQHPEHGRILAVNLISLAEQNGLANGLTHQAFSKALERATYGVASSRRYVSCDAELRSGRRLQSLQIDTPGAAVLAC
jgi:EAL domain-containing protein (putative c-di-GMP-specific phosphodiesterase class I)